MNAIPGNKIESPAITKFYPSVNKVGDKGMLITSFTYESRRGCFTRLCPEVNMCPYSNPRRAVLTDKLKPKKNNYCRCKFIFSLRPCNKNTYPRYSYDGIFNPREYCDPMDRSQADGKSYKED